MAFVLGAVIVFPFTFNYLNITRALVDGTLPPQVRQSIHGFKIAEYVVPPYSAFTIYRWDINARMPTIIGFVGGGGIDLRLQQQISLLRYREAGVAVLAIAIVVSILDYVSAWIRARLI